MKTNAILLAAGHGLRMNSDLPKVLHPVAGKPMLWHTLQAVAEVTTEKPVVIIGHQADIIRNYIGDQAHCILQEQQLGNRPCCPAGKEFLGGKNRSGSCHLRRYASPQPGNTEKTYPNPNG